jgi:drug/metabolite transporter (DMT)-like permease
MRKTTWRANLLLLLVTANWGFGFVSQRVGMQHLGVYTFNALRFGLGCLVLLLLFPLLRRITPDAKAPGARINLSAGVAAGLVLFAASTLQTGGMAFTTAGKAGFITGLYVILVPLMGLFWRQRAGPGIWIGAVLSLAGLYLLSVSDGLQISTGDLMVLASALFWAAHIQVVAHYSTRANVVLMSIVQYFTVALLSLAAGLAWERAALPQVQAVTGAILYNGLIVVGVSYTLQILAQREAHPGHAAIIMLSEALFALLAGWLLLGEILPLRGLAGCALMLAGMLVSQAGNIFFRVTPRNSASHPSYPDLT